MARAEKIIDGEIQIEAFMPKLAEWLRKAIKLGAVKIIAQNESEIEQPKSDNQREKFHAMIGDIQATGVLVIPSKRIVFSRYDKEQCKALLVMWFANEKSEMGEPIPNPPQNFLCPITGENISIRPSTTKWGKRLTCEFVEWLYSIGAMSNTVWSEKAIEAYQSYKEAQQ